MPAPVLSERDLSALRSFARRIDPADAGAHNNLGVLYYHKGLIPEAVAAFQRALELDSRMTIAQANLEIAYRESGHYDHRVAELRERLRARPDDREARWDLGRVYASLGHHDEAAAEFEALLTRHPDDVAALVQLGLAERARGRVEEATEWFAEACRRDPGSAVALFYYGETLYNRGLNEPALAALQGAVGRNPDYADAHYLLAFVHGDMGQHDLARTAAKRAIELNPALARAQANLTLQRPEALGADGKAPPRAEPQSVADAALAHFNLGLAFRQKGYFTEALREYRLALDAGEDRRLALQAMAEVELLRRELASALQLYDQLVKEFPESPKLWSERGVCLQQLGHREDAETSYLRAVDLDPDYVIGWNNLGVLRAQDPAADATLATFQRAVRGKRVPVTVRLNMALLHFQRRELQPALEGYRAALSEEPQNAVAWNGVGLVMMELKRYAEARTAFQRAVEADAELASARYNLSFTLSQLGDFDGALRETKRALELEPFYVPQKYALALDLQYEDPTIAIAPPLSTELGGDALAGEFAFESGSLDQLFEQLVQAEPAPAPAGDDPLALARDYVAKGLLELATAEVGRARARGAGPVEVATLLGDIYARRGLHGEALEQYQVARTERPGDAHAALGEIRSLIALDRGAEAAPLAEAVALERPHDADVCAVLARSRLAAGDAHGALVAVREALNLTPGRPELYQLQAVICGQLGDTSAALEACQLALRVDAGLVQVWYELGRLEERRENWTAATAAYDQALDLLPTFTAAALARADLARRTDSPRSAVLLLVDLLSTDPYEFDALLLLGQCLLDDGRSRDALQGFDRVLRFHPEHPEALFYRGVALARERKFHEAVSAWDQVSHLASAGDLATAARSRARSARDLQHILAGGES